MKWKQGVDMELQAYRHDVAALMLASQGTVLSLYRPTLPLLFSVSIDYLTSSQYFVNASQLIAGLALQVPWYSIFVYPLKWNENLRWNSVIYQQIVYHKGFVRV